MGYVLHKLAPGWGLPSLSPACIQTEALLRFTGADFSVRSTNEPAKSPTGCLPCLEKGDDLADTHHDTAEFDASHEVIAFLKKHGDDADAHLTNSERAISGALVRLVQSDLEPATLHAAWVETEGYREYRVRWIGDDKHIEQHLKAFAGSLPFPLNHLVPLQRRYFTRNVLKNVNLNEVYGAAEAAIDSIADFLGGSPDSPYCFGESPCTLDAMLYGHLLFYNLAPVVAPVLKKKIDEHDNLRRYVDRISAQFFADVAPVPPVRTWVEDLDDATSSWSRAAQGKKPEPKPQKQEDTPEDKKLKRWGKVWLGCAALVLVAYTWYYPPPIQIITVDDMDDEDEDDLV